MPYNIESLLGVSAELYQSTADINKSLICEWNDEVKESYKVYYHQCSDKINQIQDTVSTLQRVCNELSEIDITEFEKKADELLKAAKSA